MTFALATERNDWLPFAAPSRYALPRRSYVILNFDSCAQISASGRSN